jgi:betaine-aldehyde dehydrogenase
MKYVTMELGGKSPLIILPDTDVENAVDGAMMANFFSTGQVCTNGTRVFVPSSMKTAFEKRLLEKMENIRALEPMDPNCNFGPLVSEIHFKKVLSYVRYGIDVDKAKLLHGGPSKPKNIPAGYENGFWVQPTVFTDCTDTMKITTEEIFGPVLCILTYATVDEAIVRANNTKMGLAAGVFGKNVNQCHEVISKLEAGITWINTWGESPAEMSVGGWKLSGVGVENGRRGLNAWVRERSTLVEGSGIVGTVFSKL